MTVMLWINCFSFSLNSVTELFTTCLEAIWIYLFVNIFSEEDGLDFADAGLKPGDEYDVELQKKHGSLGLNVTVSL